MLSFDPSTAVTEELNNEDQAGKKTSEKGAATAANSKKKKKAMDSLESEDNGEDSDFSGEDVNGKPEVQRGHRGGKASSRGRGKAAKTVSTEEKKGSGRGRGRPRLDGKKSSQSGSGRGRGKAGKRGRSGK